MANPPAVGGPLHVVRLTGPIFPPGDHERAEVARHGWRLTTVGGTTADEIVPHLTEADVVSVVGTRMPAAVIDALRASGRCRAIARLGQPHLWRLGPRSVLRADLRPGQIGRAHV